MAKTPNFSMKRIALDKAQAQIVATVAIAAVLSIFSLMFAKTLWSQQGFQSRLIHADVLASNQLDSNSKAVNELVNSYDNFESQSTNIIGGNSVGTNPNDGDNGTIVLDALPSEYDFPALASSISKILTGLNLSISAVSGTDNEATLSEVGPSPDPQSTAIPFTFTVTNASYTSIQDLFKNLENSIRPIQVQSIQLTGSDTAMTVDVVAQTYYQPGKTMSITKETIK